MSTLPLFDEPSTPLADKLRPKLAELAAQQVFIGTSSWKYEGWIGQIYSRERYLSRGRFAKKKFEAECLAEYAQTFPIVCGDFSFYQFPPEAFWQRLFSSAPSGLRYAFKVPEEITVKRFPVHERYGPRAGQDNETFLNAHVFTELFLRPLESYRQQIAALIFEFGLFSKTAFDNEAPFIEQLDQFLGSLPQGFRYSVEVRNPEFLTPEYFRCLRAHETAHVFNSRTRMPDLGWQLEIDGAYTAGFTLVRALLRPGRPYEEAVKLFSPYERIREPNQEARASIGKLIQQSRRDRRAAYIFVNNRLEGNAPQTIAAIIEV